ncbi:MAG: hypothetical protein H0U55_13090 [Rubrobacteraceae bacterium]|nr:hypothetical protein [Rubrobacteraceae bacterium]
MAYRMDNAVEEMKKTTIFTDLLGRDLSALGPIYLLVTFVVRLERQ